ncbi:MAG: hypothetical protein ACOX9C_07780 [Kiritimatiellia bacterium]|jgi:hypothetical protein
MTLKPDHDALPFIAFAVGAVTALLGILGLAAPSRARKLWTAFPRSVWPGRILAVIALAWSALWICVMPLGPLVFLRNLLWLLLPLAIAATWIYIPDLLACRAVGALLMLVPVPMLSTAAWHPSPWRYVMIVYAYAMIVAGMFYISLPWLLRDHIDWIHRTPQRAKAIAAAASVLGLLLVVLAFTAFSV